MALADPPPGEGGSVSASEWSPWMAGPVSSCCCLRSIGRNGLSHFQGSRRKRWRRKSTRGEGGLIGGKEPFHFSSRLRHRRGQTQRGFSTSCRSHAAPSFRSVRATGVLRCHPTPSLEDPPGFSVLYAAVTQCHVPPRWLCQHATSHCAVR